MKPMRIRKIGEKVYQSYDAWRAYIERQRELTIIKNKLIPSVNKLKDRLESISNTYLGERGLYFEMEKLRNKTTDLKKDVLRFLNLKQFRR
tara:strand:+ start:881 stop:1153 length:273 start_codon:yes stop_codon:yes gene_type:complete